MHSSENFKQSRLPKRFPVGSTYVIEGRGGADGHLRVLSRYVELPGGRRIELGGAENHVQTMGKSHSNRAKKIMAGAGTPRQHRR